MFIILYGNMKSLKYLSNLLNQVILTTANLKIKQQVKNLINKPC